jgi:hypothetical protein
MVSRPLELHPEAEQEYLSALRWYRERSVTAAINFESAVAEAINKVKDNQNAGLGISRDSEGTLSVNFPSALSIRFSQRTF